MRNPLHSNTLTLATLLGIVVLLAPLSATAANQPPNIVFILCDDLGYGDVHCLAPDTGKIATPNCDQLAAAGMIFTDAHSGSSVCTPTRYGLLTGRYSWRTRLQHGVVTGFAPSLIAAERPTVARFLQQAGYHTAVIGKWHLDFEYLDPETSEPYRQNYHKQPPVGAKIPDGPINRGFDYFHGFHHARNMQAVIENNTVIEHDAVEHMLPRLEKQAVAYIDSRRGSQQPFFLYLPLCSPHTPIVPSPAWQGKSGLGPYGDYVMQTDAVLGAVTEALNRNDLTDTTLVIFSSDNGCSKAAKIERLAKQGHKVSAHLRGSKADIWDGGHRVPFIVSWPGKVAPGTSCDQLICLTDFFATVAEIVDRPTPPESCEDSVSILPALKGQEIASTRYGVIHHSSSGHFAYRQGRWKLALARGSGGWSSPTEKEVPPDAPEGQLYDMLADPGETTNLYSTRPEVVQRLLELLQADIERGRSTSGPAAVNDYENIILWKSGPEGRSSARDVRPN